MSVLLGCFSSPPNLGLVFNEIAGVAEIHHDLDFRSIATHLSLWEKDGASAHVSRKLVSLLATHKSSEILRLVSSLLKTAGSNLTVSSFFLLLHPLLPLSLLVVPYIAISGTFLAILSVP